MLLTGTLIGATLLRASDQVLRYSIDKATIELLYLPVPAAETFSVKSFIDTVVYRMGDGLGGIAVLVFAGAACVTDLRDGRIPNVLTFGAIAVAFVVHALLPQGRGLARRLVAQAARRVLDEGAVPTYLHDPANVASAKVADAAGLPDRGWSVLGLFERQP